MIWCKFYCRTLLSRLDDRSLWLKSFRFNISQSSSWRYRIQMTAKPLAETIYTIRLRLLSGTTEFYIIDKFYYCCFYNDYDFEFYANFYLFRNMYLKPAISWQILTFNGKCTNVLFLTVFNKTIKCLLKLFCGLEKFESDAFQKQCTRSNVLYFPSTLVQSGFNNKYK